MKKRLIPWIALAAAGCHSASTEPSTQAPPSQPAPSSTPPSPSAPTQPPTASSGPAAQPEQPATAPPATTAPTAPTAAPTAAPALPAPLKNPAYEYYGLGNDKPMEYDVVGAGNGSVISGLVTTTLKEVGVGAAMFTQTRTGGLAGVGGADTLMLDAVGIHVVGYAGATVDPNNLEFPADITPGHKWTSHDKFDKPGNTLDIVNEGTVVGMTKVKVKRGTLDALLISSKGTGTENGEKVRIDTQSWYVKGLGNVKSIVDRTARDGQKARVTEELTN